MFCIYPVQFLSPPFPPVKIPGSRVKEFSNMRPWRLAMPCKVHSTVEPLISLVQSKNSSFTSNAARARRCKGSYAVLVGGSFFFFMEEQSK